ncbi:MAG: major tail protein [Christensenellales bacterium]|jgi:phage major tail protein, phi13 family
MAFVGLLYAVAAPIQTEADGQAITYGKGQVIGGMMTAEISYTRNSNPLYADDRVMEEDNSITGGTIKMGVDDVNDDARVMMLGDVKEGDAGEEVYHETGESAPYVGTGYIRVRRKDNKTNYIAYWVHKAIFGIGTESAKTKGQNIEWQTPTLEGSIMGVKNNAALQTRFRERRTFTKESEARAWLNKKAGIEA